MQIVGVHRAASLIAYGSVITFNDFLPTFAANCPTTIPFRGKDMKTKLILVALATFTAASVYAQSTTNTPRIDKREVKQEQRIEQGKSSGSLNDKEAVRLEKGQANVAAAEAKAKEDGKVTKKERAKITHKQNVQSKRIAKQKHDAQTKPAVTPAPAN
jgi:hypothetical protein